MIILDMDSSVSPTHGEQEGTAYNGHFGRTCYHPLFLFNQFGDLEWCALRPGNVHSADDWEGVLKPVVVRYRGRKVRLYFQGNAAFAAPEMYEYLEAEGFLYAIRLPKNQVFLGKHRPSAHATRWPSAEPCAALLRQLQLPGWELGQKAARGGQGRMASWGTGSPCRLHRH